MASGDTKTNQYLDIAANGTRADLPSDTCCETRTQTLIRGVAERIMDVEEEVEQLENNPDVVDIVDTYAELQGYDTSGLTDKDIIRVIADETKGGLSSYYRWNSPNPGWNFVGVIPGGDGIKELSSADYNYPTANPDRVALWLLDNGLYTAPAGVMVAASTTSYPWYNTSDKTILVGGSDTVKGIYTFLNSKVDVVTTQASDGTEADEYTLLKSTQVLQATGQSTTDTMSQKAITDAIAGGGGMTELTADDYNWNSTAGDATTEPFDCIALWLLEPGNYAWKNGVYFKLMFNWSPNANTGQAVVWDAGVNGSSVAMTGVFATYSQNNAQLRIINSSTGTQIWGNLFLLSTDVYQGGDFRKVRIGYNTSSTGTDSVAIGTSASSTTATSVAIGFAASSTGSGSVAIGSATKSRSIVSTAIGDSASATRNGSIALGAYSSVTQIGEMNIGSTNTFYGYNSSNYRLLTGLYDGQSAHDAATYGQLSTAIINGGTTAPTTATIGAVGTLYSAVVSNTAHLYACTAIDDTTDPQNPSYTWTTLV